MWKSSYHKENYVQVIYIGLNLKYKFH